MEQLLHYVWKHRLFPLKPLQTTAGRPVEILDVGIANCHAGPDFFNAKIKIDGVLWVGNVELHVRASDWKRHGHAADPAYDSVILHVVSEADRTVCRTDGTPVPQLVLPVPPRVLEGYRQLLQSDRYPPCCHILPELPRLVVHDWLASLRLERLADKTGQLEQLAVAYSQDWEHVFFVSLARSFGFGVNADIFERWAKTIPLAALAKHRDRLVQIEAVLFGHAGLLQGAPADAYMGQLQQEYAYLCHKFGLQPPTVGHWRFLRLRPNNFPHVRIAQLACLYHRGQGLLSQLLEADGLSQWQALLKGGTSDYWVTHYTFGPPTEARPKSLSRKAIDLLLINTVVPFLYAYGKWRLDESLCERAKALMEELKPEDNHIIRMWQECGLKVEHAGDSQALIQLKKNYCDLKKCLYCRFGYAYLKAARQP